MTVAEGNGRRLEGCPDVVRVEGRSHASNLSRPEAVNRAIADFLAGL